MRFPLLLLLPLLMVTSCGDGATITAPNPTGVACQVTGSGNVVNCSGGSGSSVGNPPVPTPTPTPGGGPTSAECAITSVAVAFTGGEAPEMLVGSIRTLDATPFNGSGQVSDACNVGRVVSWGASPASVCKIEGAVSSFNPQLRGVGVGECTVTATVLNVLGGPLVIRVR